MTPLLLLLAVPLLLATAAGLSVPPPSATEEALDGRTIAPEDELLAALPLSILGRPRCDLATRGAKPMTTSDRRSMWSGA